MLALPGDDGDARAFPVVVALSHRQGAGPVSGSSHRIALPRMYFLAIGFEEAIALEG